MYHSLSAPLTDFYVSVCHCLFISDLNILHCVVRFLEKKVIKVIYKMIIIIIRIQIAIVSVRAELIELLNMNMDGQGQEHG